MILLDNIRETRSKDLLVEVECTAKDRGRLDYDLQVFPVSRFPGIWPLNAVVLIGAIDADSAAQKGTLRLPARENHNATSALREEEISGSNIFRGLRGVCLFERQPRRRGRENPQEGSWT